MFGIGKALGGAGGAIGVPGMGRPGRRVGQTGMNPGLGVKNQMMDMEIMDQLKGQPSGLGDFAKRIGGAGMGMGPGFPGGGPIMKPGMPGGGAPIAKVPGQGYQVPPPIRTPGMPTQTPFPMRGRSPMQGGGPPLPPGVQTLGRAGRGMFGL